MNPRLTAAFKSIGIGESVAKKQLEDLSSLISLLVLEKVIAENPEQNLQPDNVLDFVKKNYTAEKLVALTESVSEEAVRGYLSSITSRADEDTKNIFYSEIKTALVQPDLEN